MYDRFSASARTAVARSEAVAHARGATDVGPEDVLIALAEHPGVAGSVLRAVAADPDLLRDAVTARRPAVEPSPGLARPLPLAHATVECFTLAVREADGFRLPQVGTEHLLLGLLRESTGRVTELLMSVRRDPGLIRERVLDLVSTPGFVSPETPGAAPVPATVHVNASAALSDLASGGAEHADQADARRALSPEVAAASTVGPAAGRSAVIASPLTPADRELLEDLFDEIAQLRAEVAALRAELNRREGREIRDGRSIA